MARRPGPTLVQLLSQKPNLLSFSGHYLFIYLFLNKVCLPLPAGNLRQCSFVPAHPLCSHPKGNPTAPLCFSHHHRAAMLSDTLSFTSTYRGKDHDQIQGWGKQRSRLPSLLQCRLGAEHQGPTSQPCGLSSLGIPVILPAPWLLATTKSDHASGLRSLPID